MPDDERTPSRGLRIRLLGAFEAVVDGVPVADERWPRRKAKTLVKLLALQPNRRLHREQAMEILWPELGRESAANQLNKAVHGARRAFEPDLPARGTSRFLSTDGDEIALAPDAVSVDVEIFEAAAAAALRRPEAEAADAALRIYRGDLLPGDLYEEWVAAARERLRLLHDRLLAHLARSLESSGEVERAIEVWSALLERDSLHEDAHCALVRLYARGGDIHASIRQAERFREMLRDELGVAPAPQVEAMIAHTHALAREGAAAAPSRDRESANEGEPAREHGSAEPRAAALEVSGNGDETAVSVAAERPRATFGRGVPSPSGNPVIARRSRPLERPLRPWHAAAAAVAIVSVLTGAVFASNGKVRHRFDLVVAKARMRAADLTGSEPRLVALTGRVDLGGARVEALNSKSGWAAFAGSDGSFTLPAEVWYPGARFELLVESPSGEVRLVTVDAPSESAPGGAIDLGQIGAGIAIAPPSYGANSITVLEEDTANADYYRGIYSALASSGADDAARLDAILRFVHSRRVVDRVTPAGGSAREVIELGSSHSGDLCRAMAAIVRAGGYEARLINVLAPGPDRAAHMAVEIRTGDGWSVHDPTFEWKAPGLDLARRPLEGSFANVPSWVAAAFRSGAHHYYVFRDA